MGIIILLVVGGLIGWVASMIMRTDAQQGVFMNIVVGIVGALLAGFLLTPLIGGAPITSGNISIPSILISLLGTIGSGPALIALSLYALLPVVRNTCIGLLQVSPGIRAAAMALGLKRRDTLLLIELPLALPVILAGVKTAAIMSVGTATIAAFIGAGGYGERIAVGLALNDHEMLLAGAIPAAVLALLTQGLFEGAEYLVSRRRAGL